MAILTTRPRTLQAEFRITVLDWVMLGFISLALRLVLALGAVLSWMHRWFCICVARIRSCLGLLLR